MEATNVSDSFASDLFALDDHAVAGAHRRQEPSGGLGAEVHRGTAGNEVAQVAMQPVDGATPGP
jgi:hypothetical protein